MTTTESDALAALSFGQRVAEEETAELAGYFVLTEQWRQLLAGDVDVVYGYKGVGKSALYSSLLGRQDELFDRRILVVAGENVRGAPIFRDLVEDPPASESQFKDLWKLYLLQLIGSSLRDYEFSSEPGKQLIAKLEEAGLFPKKGGLVAFFRSAIEYIRRSRVESVQGTVEVDKFSGLPSGLTGKITFREPTAESLNQGYISLDGLLALADEALTIAEFSIWILLDRLDVAFAGNSDLEANALRALFLVYGDLRQYERVRLKIFLRTDIWTRITEEDFREASHITRKITIQWDKKSLMNLVIRRVLAATSVTQYYDVSPDAVLGDIAAQEALFKRIFPPQVEKGGGRPAAFDWMLSRTSDASKQAAPRELIHLLTESRNEQIKKEGIGEPSPDGEVLIAGHNIREALKEVSKVRYEQTLLAEYPKLKPYLTKLRGAKAEHKRATLAQIWDLDEGQAGRIADELVEAGFFVRGGTVHDPEYWIPLLYRDALGLIRGGAFKPDSASRGESDEGSSSSPSEVLE